MKHSVIERGGWRELGGRAAKALTVTLLLIGTLTLAFFIRPVKASGTIYIRVDGNVDPPTAPISSVDNVTYSFTGNINDSIVVERDNIVIDGAGFRVQGTGAFLSIGIGLSGRTNVTIKNVEVKAFYFGIWLSNSSNYNSICGNNITDAIVGIGLYDSSNYNNICANSLTNNRAGIWLVQFSNFNSVVGNNVAESSRYGIRLSYSSDYNNIVRNNVTGSKWIGVELSTSYNNSISENNITNNEYGIWLYGASGNSVFHNNFLNNTFQFYTSGSVNVWDDDYPSGGNYWSDYEGENLYSGPYQNETGSDGIGDTPYAIDLDNQDKYPLIFSWPPMLGDLNGDGKIDIKDLALAAKAFGSYPSHPRWNSRADVDQDGRVYIKDLAIVARNFGKTYP